MMRAVITAAILVAFAASAAALAGCGRKGDLDAPAPGLTQQ